MVHDRPALPRGGLKNRRSWDQRCTELAEFRLQHGRLPRSYIEGESSLYSFLQYQRRLRRTGQLFASRKSVLKNKVPGWLTPPKTEPERALWQQRLTELENFLSQTGRYPSYKKAVEPLEKILAVWLQRQRHCLRTGRMALYRQEKLNSKLPDWITHCSEVTVGSL